MFIDNEIIIQNVLILESYFELIGKDSKGEADCVQGKAMNQQYGVLLCDELKHSHYKI